MRSTLVPLALCAALGAVGAPADAAPRVVLIGVDGGSWNLIGPGIASGQLPALAALAARGVQEDLETVEPVNSPTVWTSIATGRTPDVHGIRSFYATRLGIGAPTLWERLAAQDLTVGTYDYLMTWPPLELDKGFAIPGWLRRDASVTPTDVFERAGLEPYTYSNQDQRGPDDVVADIRAELAHKAGHFVRLLETFEPDVAAVTFYALDAASHRFWREAFPEEFDASPHPLRERYAGIVHEALVGVDRAIGRIAAALDPDDTLIVVSDHGFRAAPAGSRNVWVTHVKPWLAHAELDPERDAFSVNGGFGLIAARVHPGPFEARERTLERLQTWLAGAATPAGEPLFQVYTLDVAERPPGYERALGERIRQLAVRLYLWWQGAESDQPAHAWVLALPNAERLDALYARPESVARVGEVDWPLARLAHPDEFNGTHDPTGIFLAAGPALRATPADAPRGRVSVLDVAPLVFHLSGRPVPDDLDGAVPTRLLRPEHLAARPVRTVDARTLPAVGAPSTRADATPQERAALTERLRALGYVE